MPGGRVAVGEGCWANWLLRVASASWGWPLCLDCPPSAPSEDKQDGHPPADEETEAQNADLGPPDAQLPPYHASPNSGGLDTSPASPWARRHGACRQPGASSAPPSLPRPQGVRVPRCTGPGISALETPPASQHLHHPRSLVSSSWPRPSSLPIGRPRKHRQREMGPRLSWPLRTLPSPISPPYPPLAWRLEDLTLDALLGCKPGHLGVTQMSLVLSSW